MTLASQLTTDMASFFNTDEFAESVTYTPISGSPTTITAIVTRSEPFQEEYVRGRETARAEIEVQKSEVATPKHGDTFTFDSQIWELDPSLMVIYEDDQKYTIALERELS